MTDPLVVLVFVLARDPHGKSELATPSMSAAARQALGASTTLLIEERTALPPDDEALAVAERVRATAVAELDWFAEPTTVVLHVHTTQRSSWAQRAIVFAPTEDPVECGRTLGFAMASMITGLGVPPAPPEPPRDNEPSPTPVEPKTPQRASAPPPARDERTSTPAAAPPTRYTTIEANAVASAGDGQSSNSLGASASVGATVVPWLTVLIDGSIRFGSISSAQATFTSVQLGGGASWRTISTSGPRPFELDVRGDLLAHDIIVYRSGASRSRWLPDASLSLDAVWFVIGQGVGVVASAGIDASFGTTSVAIGNDTVATLPPLRAIGAVGIRARF
jgi:hypothetical protein